MYTVLEPVREVVKIQVVSITVCFSVSNVTSESDIFMSEIKKQTDGVLDGEKGHQKDVLWNRQTDQITGHWAKDSQGRLGTNQHNRQGVTAPPST